MKIEYTIIAFLVLFSSVGFSFWYNNSCTIKSNFTFDNGWDSENLTNYPVLLVLNNSNSMSNKSENIQIYDPVTNSTLGRSSEKWNNGNNSFVWTKIPLINAFSTTDYIEVYSNCSSNSINNIPVWNNNYSLALYLNESQTTTIYDYSPYLNNLTRNAGGGAFNNSNLIDGSFTTNNMDDYTTGSALTIDGAESMTFSVWANTTTCSGTSGIGGWGETAGGGANRYGLSCAYPNVSNWGQFGGGSGDIDSSFPFESGNWTNLVMTYDGTNFKYYKNGIQNGSTIVAFNIVASTFRLGFVVYNNGKFYYDGRIDQLEISNVTRSNKWINATYLNEYNKFGVYGAIMSNFTPPAPPDIGNTTRNVCINDITLEVNRTFSLKIDTETTNITTSEDINCPEGCFNGECAPNKRDQSLTIIGILVVIGIVVYAYKKWGKYL